MHRSALVLSCFFSLLCVTAFSQLPNTQIFIFDLKEDEAGFKIENGSYVSSFNPGGYNNQPYFIDGQTLLISSDWRTPGKTDIYRLELSTGKAIRLTATEQNEFSPSYDKGNSMIYVVQQETDTVGAGSQQLFWAYPKDLSDFGRPILESVKNVGYYETLDSSRIALFTVGPPHKLVIYNLADNSEQFVAYNIGRSFRADGSGGVYYVQEIGNTRVIRNFSTASGTSRRIAQMLPDQIDFGLTADGDLLAGQGTKLYLFDMKERRSWEEIAELGNLKSGEITRIRVFDNKVGIVLSR
jgi:hypothetical protein